MLVMLTILQNVSMYVWMDVSKEELYNGQIRLQSQIIVTF